MYINEPLYLKYIIVYLLIFYFIKSSQFCFVNLGYFFMFYLWAWGSLVLFLSTFEVLHFVFFKFLSTLSN